MTSEESAAKRRIDVLLSAPPAEKLRDWLWLGVPAAVLTYLGIEREAVGAYLRLHPAVASGIAGALSGLLAGYWLGRTRAPRGPNKEALRAIYKQAEAVEDHVLKVINLYNEAIRAKSDPSTLRSTLANELGHRVDFDAPMLREEAAAVAEALRTFDAHVAEWAHVRGEVRFLLGWAQGLEEYGDTAMQTLNALKVRAAEVAVPYVDRYVDLSKFDERERRH